ncbi:hypothetical protein B0H13DRAFT_2348498 [Mycena leptocephala]|nr:hypothetical protein B0H13DRAFT_2348498 [Mycena leptocephala]
MQKRVIATEIVDKEMQGTPASQEHKTPRGQARAARAPGTSTISLEARTRNHNAHALARQCYTPRRARLEFRSPWAVHLHPRTPQPHARAQAARAPEPRRHARLMQPAYANVRQYGAKSTAPLQDAQAGAVFLQNASKTPLLRPATASK